ncbi:MAG: hypothetical protein L6V93_22075 [Clostridiales bacterium]|nr:MAG: hypothetical protein L6V93_22075 [Clostridiales bacterium]
MLYTPRRKGRFVQKKFKYKFREGKDWKLSLNQFKTGKRDKEWDFTKIR